MIGASPLTKRLDPVFGDRTRHQSDDAWLRAIDDAVPGEVSRGATTLWALRFNRIALTDYIDWPDTAHLRDFRPLAKLSKAQFLDRLRYSHTQSDRLGS